jgi:hypothetical protein
MPQEDGKMAKDRESDQGRGEVGRRRVLRLMRKNNLLSPYRGRRGSPRLHEGEIITQAANLWFLTV